MTTEWEKLKEYIRENLVVWTMTEASSSQEDSLKPYFIAKKEAFALMLEKMDQLDSTKPKKPGCCT